MGHVVGVNVTSSHAYFALAREGAIEDGELERLEVPPTDAGGSQLIDALADLKRRLASPRPRLVAILGGGANVMNTEVAFRPRITYEALVRLAAEERDIPLELVSRAKVRSQLGLPKKGNLTAHLAAAGPTVGRYWKVGRGLAALAALAAEKENA